MGEKKKKFLSSLLILITVHHYEYRLFSVKLSGVKKKIFGRIVIWVIPFLYQLLSYKEMETCSGASSEFSFFVPFLFILFF